MFADVSPGFLPDYFWVMLLALVIVAVVASLLMFGMWWVIDKITPGDLARQLLGEPVQPGQTRGPNLALAVVVGTMFLGFSIIIGCTVIGVLAH